MLHTETIESSTLELLKSLQQKEYFKNFYLVGGSALALYYGHRRSDDIDLFSKDNFDAQQLLEQIHQDFSYQLSYTAESTLKGTISGVKVDVIAHRYPFLRDPITVDSISLLSEEDIIAMKFNAMSISGQRSKDFIDIYYGLKTYTISDMIDFYKTKYNQQDASHVLKSLIYFDDVDLADWPVLVKDPDLKWETVMNKIEKEVIQFVNRK